MRGGCAPRECATREREPFVIRGTPRRYRFEWLLLGVVPLTLGALTGDRLYAEHGRIESLERDRLQVQARVIDENPGRQPTVAAPAGADAPGSGAAEGVKAQGPFRNNRNGPRYAVARSEVRTAAVTRTLALECRDARNGDRCRIGRSIAAGIERVQHAHAVAGRTGEAAGKRA